MAQRQTGAKVYRSMQGKQVDLDQLRKKNELTPAVGNVRMNARGDELGPGGKIIRSKEEIVKEYYQRTPQPDVLPETETVTKETEKPNNSTARKPNSRTKKKDPDEILKQDAEDEWIEDEDGNFVKRGENGN